MKNKGFTLIELLAVIVILAIITLIATPIILNIIEDARVESNKRSIDNYARAIKNAVASYQLKKNEAPKSIDDLYKINNGIKDFIEYDSDVDCKTKELYKDGSVYLADCIVNDNNVSDYSYGKEIKPCSLKDEDKNEKISLGDIVTCGTENFYVMYNKNKEITMLSMYNLNVDRNEKESIQNKNLDGYNTGIIGYDEQYDVHDVISKYQTYLTTQLKVNSAKSSLINEEQLITLGCYSDEDYYNCSDAPGWLYSTIYWTYIVNEDYIGGDGSLSEYGDGVGVVYTDGVIGGVVFSTVFSGGQVCLGGFLGNCYSDDDYGARPVITFSEEELNY